MLIIYFGYQLYSKLCTNWNYDNRDCFRKINRLGLDRLNEKIERFILILFKHDPLYIVSQGKKNVYHDSLFWLNFFLLNHPIVHSYILCKYWHYLFLFCFTFSKQSSRHSSPFHLGSFKNCVVKMRWVVSTLCRFPPKRRILSQMSTNTVWPQPIWKKVRSLWQIPLQYLGGPESA